ncbi:MAG: hypothetical protein DRJ66_07325 [Thermoprotei archaeon]|nr:MAG: hypothetical protein DRJ66_07325 [Thermoprotei archaeon]RLF19717.1 MAG: hypothetical protein DRZ82_04665 [Thermoprotei archaeon]
MIKVTVEVDVFPTENINKVKKALLNVFEPSSLKVMRKGIRRKIVAKGQGSMSLMKIYRKLREERILDTARRYLKAGITNENKIVFFIHKQAAYVGVVSFCDSEIRSPLGHIKFEIETDDPKTLIDWLTPKTVRGVPIKEVPPPD